MASRVRYRPELATLVEAPPIGPDWIHEIKFDGYRIGADLDAGRVHLDSRREIDWTPKFPEVVAALEALPCNSALVDGEVAITMPEGHTSFQALQNSFKGGSRAGLTYYVFDLLELDGRSLAALPLEDRKTALSELIGTTSTVLRYSRHFEVDGAELLRRACSIGAEGIVSKKRLAKHRPGRSDNWLKTKCTKRQHFVIGGFSEPEGSRSGVGALLLGVYEKGALVFCGGVGTGRGWTGKFLEELRRGLDGIEQKECPFAVKPPPAYSRGARWVRPALVCEVAFTEWTNDGTLRHPSFQTFKPGVEAKEVGHLHHC